MSAEKMSNEVLNLRCFYIRLLRKLPLVLVITALGAVLGLAVYFLATVVFGPGVRYETSSTLYIDFAYDPETGTLVDYYNAYTWNTIITGTDEITDNIMSRLGEDAPDKKTVLSAITAEIPSDVRVMVLTVTYPEKEIAEAINRATCASLEDFGRSNPAFDSITELSLDDEAEPVVMTDRSAVAAILGAVIFFLLSAVILMLIQAMDDSVFVPEDAEKRYSLPVLGVLSKENAPLPDMFRGELISAMKPLLELNRIMVISADDRDDNDAPAYASAEKTAVRLRQILSSASDDTLPEFVPGDGIETASFDGALIVIRYGRHNRAMTEHMISRLSRSGCPILGLVIIDADPFFLKRYYKV